MRKEKTAPLPKRALPDALALCRQNFPDSGAALSPEGEGSGCPISLRRTAGAGGGLQADPVFWNRHAPVLFPNVGKYYGGHFTYNGKAYPMGQHGFARDTEFEQIAAGEDFVTYRLCADEESKKKYPFDFVLEITHRLENNRLSVEWNVKNADDKEMYFTIGGHPAFNVNILPDTDFEDYSLVFKEGIETLSYILIDAENGTALTDKTYKLELTNSKYTLKKDMLIKMP